MSTKQNRVFRRIWIVVIALIVWVGLALLMTFGTELSRPQPVVSPISEALPPSPPSSGFTPFLAGGLPVMKTKEPSGSLVVTPQYVVPAIQMQLPTRYDLIDFRYQPDLKLQELK